MDEGTTMADLKGLLDQFAHAMFGAASATRFRPGYYPFTEPSVAFDVQCVVCDGAGCPACSRTGWMTILGAGMVHPVVLRYGGLDPERYQGFAFGMGVERISNLRHAVGDLRSARPPARAVDVDVVAQPRQRRAHRNCSRNRRSFSIQPQVADAMAQVAIRSTPIPNAKPWYRSGSRPPLRRTTGWTMPAPRIVIQPVREQAGQPEPPQTRHSTSNATDGSVNG